MHIKGSTASFKLPDYQDLAEMQIEKNLDEGITLGEFHELKLQKNRRKFRRMATLNSKEKKKKDEEEQENKTK